MALKAALKNRIFDEVYAQMCDDDQGESSRFSSFLFFWCQQVKSPNSMSRLRGEFADPVNPIAGPIFGVSGQLGPYWAPWVTEFFPSMKGILRLRLWMTWAFTLVDVGVYSG